MIPWTLNAMGWGALTVISLTSTIQNFGKPGDDIGPLFGFILSLAVFLGSVYMLGYCDRKKPNANPS